MEATSVPLGVILFAIGMVLLLVAVGVMLYGVAFGERAKLQKRMAAVLGHPTHAKQKNVKAALGAQQAKRKAIQSKLKGLEAKRSRKKSAKLREQIQQAGLTWSIRQYVVISVVLALVGTLGYLITDLPSIGAVFVALIFGLGLPRFILVFLKKRRLKKFTQLFADAIDVIVRGIKSGLPVGECISLIGREMPDPVGVEFRLISEAQKLGVTLDEALQKTIARVPTPEVKFFAIVLSIQQQTGGNLAETLGKLSDVLRQRKRMRDKVQAMSQEAKSSAGIIGSLPIVVSGILFLVAPDYIGLLFSTDTGHIMLGVAVGIMSVGVFIMRQMINFDI